MLSRFDIIKQKESGQSIDEIVNKTIFVYLKETSFYVSGGSVYAFVHDERNGFINLHTYINSAIHDGCVALQHKNSKNFLKVYIKPEKKNTIKDELINILKKEKFSLEGYTGIMFDLKENEIEIGRLLI